MMKRGQSWGNATGQGGGGTYSSKQGSLARPVFWLFILEIVSLCLGDKDAFPPGTETVPLIRESYSCFRVKNGGKAERPPASIVFQIPSV